jgi:hypothetical protein
MPPYKAERTLLGVAIEGSQKTEVVPERVPGYTTGTVTPPGLEIDWIEERPVGADRELFDPVEGQHSFEGGSVTLYPYDGWPLAFVMGAETVNADTPSVGITEHVLTANNSDNPPTATMEQTFIGATGQDDLVIPYLGVFGTSAEISQDNEGIMEVSLDHQALGVPDDAPRTSFTDVRPLPSRDPWKFSDVDSDLSLFSTSFAEVQDFSLSIDTGSEPQYYAESSEAPEPYEATYGMADYTLDVTISVTDNSLYNELVGPTTDGFTSNLSFSKQHSTDDSLDINATECRMESGTPEIPEEGPATVDVSIIPGSLTITVQDSQSAGTGYLSAGSTP